MAKTTAKTGKTLEQRKAALQNRIKKLEIQEQIQKLKQTAKALK